jgi:hypothetical protein
MNTEQIKDMHLLYNAVYNEELREQFEEYNNTIYDEDIVEVATEYFYSYGLNADGIDILIENVGLESFVEYVYELSEDLYDLTEARRARKRTGGESYAEVKAKIDAKEAAKRKVATAATEKREVERKEPESRGPESEAKTKQPKSKKPERKSIADRISNAIKSGVERHNKATATAGRLAGETGKTLGKLAKGVGSVAGQVGSGAGTVGKVSKKVLFGEEVDLFDYILEHLVAEGYADTNESALVIMANMSEEWRDDIVEKTAMSKRGHDETAIRNKIAKSTGGGEAADRATELENRPTFGDRSKQASREKLARTQRGDFRRTTSSDYGLRLGAHKSDDPTVKAKQKARGAQRSALTPKEKKMLNREAYEAYEFVASYLLENNFASTVDDANVIINNMSENWFNQIMEG